MDLKHLAHLIALAEEGRFVAAARRVHLSQAAFSRSIQALEHNLGLRLFERGPRGARLTPVGRTVVQRARQLVFDSQCLRRDIELVRNASLGELSFGAGPVPAATLVPPLLAALHEGSPQLQTQVRAGNFESLRALLDAEAIDFFMADGRLVKPERGLQTLALGQLRGALYCRARHPLARKAVVSADDLRPYGIAMVSMTAALRAQLARALGFRDADDLPLRISCDDLGTLWRLAQQGDTLVMLPHAVVQGMGKAMRLVPVHARGKPVPPLFADLHAV